MYLANEERSQRIVIQSADLVIESADGLPKTWTVMFVMGHGATALPPAGVHSLLHHPRWRHRWRWRGYCSGAWINNWDGIAASLG